jgi:PPP family 3-phenylpropionic acid transporter
MWGLGVALGSLLAGKYWDVLSGQWIFIIAGLICLFGLVFIKALPNNKMA